VNRFEKGHHDIARALFVFTKRSVAGKVQAMRRARIPVARSGTAPVGRAVRPGQRSPVLGQRCAAGPTPRRRRSGMLPPRAPRGPQPRRVRGRPPPAVSPAGAASPATTRPRRADGPPRSRRHAPRQRTPAPREPFDDDGSPLVGVRRRRQRESAGLTPPSRRHFGVDVAFARTRSSGRGRGVPGGAAWVTRPAAAQCGPR
jgi:hypothetical protein